MVGNKNYFEGLSAQLPMVIMGGIYLSVALIYLVTGGQSQTEAMEWKLFTVGWLVIPVLSLLGGHLLNRLQQSRKNNHFCSLLLFINSVLLLISTGILKYLFDYQSIGLGTGYVLLGVSVLNILVLAAFARYPAKFSLFGSVWFLKVASLAPLIVGASFYIAVSPALSMTAFLLVGIVSVIMTGICLMGPAKLSQRWGVGDYVALFVIIILTIDLRLPFSIDHYDYYLGPVLGILNGKALLVDLSSQYGVLIHYFVGFLFKLGIINADYVGLNLVITTLSIVQHFMVYAVFRAFFSKRILVCGAMALFLVVAFWGAPHDMAASAIPSIGALRFSLPYFLLGMFLFRARFPKYYVAIRRTEVAFLAMTSLWSLETFVYTAATFAGIAMAECWNEHRNMKLWIRHLAARAGVAWGFIFLAHGAFAVGTFLYVFQWPDWNQYWFLASAYSPVGVGMGVLQMPVWGVWSLFMSIYFAALIICLANLASGDSREDSQSCLVLGTVLLGLSSFTYYLGRSHENNIYHVSMPAIILVAYFLRIWVKNVFDANRLAQCLSVFCLLFLAGAVSVNVSATVGNKVPYTLLFSLLNPKNWANHFQEFPNTSCVTTECFFFGERGVSDLTMLVNKYAPNKDRVLILADADASTQTLVNTFKTHVHPYGHLEQEFIRSPLRKEIEFFEPEFEMGDYIFVDNRLFNDVLPKFGHSQHRAVFAFNKRVLTQTCVRFNCKPIDDTGIMTAVKLY